ncbi:peptidyl-tRNA hydrolase domain protein [Talaromyces islandicus]|uniref:Peptidyl-tRNA hydrolase domain protein n=1 Tax=Talaromyces islandicus TaxID=28573 RepID=A0A0U1LSJ6_TALIS|nr:peptidyl-tRNA hydrolase domain protein [Talaromyces islandicus]
MEPVLQRFFKTSGRLARSFSSYPARSIKHLPPRPKLDDADITGTYLKGSGPGGQKINKTNSAVQLIHKPTGIVVKSQATRSRSQNQKIARELLAAKVEEQEKGEDSREAIKAAIKRKRKASSMKKKRRKYRALEEEKNNQQQEPDGPVDMDIRDDFRQEHPETDRQPESNLEKSESAKQGF